MVRFGTHTTYSSQETHDLGYAFAKALETNAIIAFKGDLGAGKTTFIRGLVEGIGAIDLRSVHSPTFTYLNIYKGQQTIYHFDLYRLPSKEEFFAAGFDEFFCAGGICCLEWAEKLENELPADVYTVSISYAGAQERQISISKVRT